MANWFTASDPTKWLTNIPRYATAVVEDIYRGIQAVYSLSADGRLTLKLIIAAGVDPPSPLFEITNVSRISVARDGSLVARLGLWEDDPYMSYAPPSATQTAPSGAVSLSATFRVQSANTFSLQVDGRDIGRPLQIELALGGPAAEVSADGTRSHTTDSAGNVFVALPVSDPAAKDAPFPSTNRSGCGFSGPQPVPCTDAAVYKFNKFGDLSFVTYLSGSTREVPRFIGVTADGSLVVTGDTESADFPVTASALQRVYGGPTPVYTGDQRVSGDFFAAKLDAITGRLLASTFLGGPNADFIGQSALGPDGSLYFIPKWLEPSSPHMPVTPAAVLKDCSERACVNGYAAHLSPALDKLLYGTYLPGNNVADAKLYSDGSVYYAGRAGPGFPATPDAYQRDPAGGIDGILARLDPQGNRLVFATYIGTPITDQILRMTVAPDGSVWASLHSFTACCLDITYKLIHIDSQGERLLLEKPMNVEELAVDIEGNLIARVNDPLSVTSDAFLANQCAYAGLVKLTPQGEQVFATYLPAGADTSVGVDSDGNPAVHGTSGDWKIVLSQSMGAFTGCVATAASFVVNSNISPGEIVTIFGSRMGPREGVSFQLDEGHVPISLGGTRVLVNGSPIPLLYVSSWQINAILPYTLQVGTVPTSY
jgi:hypothetical protein